MSKKRGKEESSKGDTLSYKEYRKALFHLHVELVKLQEWVVQKRKKVCIVFEGRDGAGKGGIIKAITERVSPRVFRVVALPAPSEREKSQMYVQRYLPHLPAAGEVVIFDRSWYNRAGVERVMGFCSDEEATTFLKACRSSSGRSSIPASSCSNTGWKSARKSRRAVWKRASTTGARFGSSRDMDLKSYSRWYDYSRARDAMFEASDTEIAPWYVANSNDKRRVRLNIISDLLGRIPYEAMPRKNVTLPKRQASDGYKEPDYPFKFITEEF